MFSVKSLNVRQTFLVLLVVATPANLLASVQVSSWGSYHIEGEDPNYKPTGTAQFQISGNVLTITLTNTTSQQTVTTGQVLTGLTWDMSNGGVTLTPLSAVIGAGSIVTKNIPPNVVAVGSPCRILREINDRDREYHYKDRKIKTDQDF